MSKKDKKMSKKDKETVAPVEEKAVDKESTPEPETKSKVKKGTLVCTRNIHDGGDKYAAGDEYKGTNKDITKHLLNRGAIKKA